MPWLTVNVRMRASPPAAILASWDARARVLDLQYAEDTILDEALVNVTRQWLEDVLAEVGPGFGILIDAANIRDATSSYRRQFGAWANAHRDAVRMAVYNVSPLVRVMSLLFGRATGMSIHIAPTREEAKRWLLPKLTP